MTSMRSIGRVIARALKIGTLVTLAGGALTAQAQQQAAQAQTQQPVETVVITGSYIPRIDKETPSPVTTISAEDIARSGLTTVSDVMRTISADNSGTLPTSFAGAFAAGASGLALRGLTVNSTLVLVDGLRAANYALPDDGVRSFVDLNSIPIGTIDRVEVLRDGASSVYGADAIGGVVNIILKKQFQGFQFNAQVGDSQHNGGYGSGFERHLDLTAGLGDLAADHYNAYVSAEWESNDRIGVGQRGYPFNTSDYTGFGGLNLNPQPGIGRGSIYGSVTPGQLGPLGTLLDGVANPGAVSQPLQPCPASAPQATDANGNVFCNQSQVGYSDTQPPTQRFGISGRFTVQVSDTTQAYLSGSYYNNQSVFPSFPPYAVSQIQTGVPNNTNNIALPVTIPVAGTGTNCVTVTVPTAACKLNPNDPFAAGGNYALINYSFGPYGAIVNDINNHNLRLVGDISGSWQGWHWDTAAVVNHTWLDYGLLNYINFNQLMTDVTDGAYNFVNPSANSPATLAALAPKVTNYDSSDMDTLVFRVNRPLLTLPGGPLQMGIGAEYRYEAQVDLNFNTVPVVQQLGFSQAIGSRNIQSVSVEFDAPVLESLELNASGRWDHYSDFGNAETPKFGFKWKPIQSLALRGTYSQGFRAPSFAENGSAEVEGFIPFGYAAGTPINAQHGNDLYITSFNLGELTTANPNIQPEKSKSYTAGLVWQPLSSFSAAADYYYIKKTNLITPPNLTPALTQYGINGTVPTGYTVVPDNPDPAFPTAIPRLVTISSGYINAPAEYTDGVDFDFNARIDLGGWGRLTEDLSATRILSFVYEQTGAPNLQYAGTQSPYNLSSGAGTPQDRASLSSNWQMGPLTLTADVYYVGAYHEYGLDVLGPGVCITTAFGFAANAANCRVGSFTYGNITGSYQVNAQWQIYGTIENVADKLPPVDTPSYNAVNYNATYSQAGIIGRFFRVGFRFMM